MHQQNFIIHITGRVQGVSFRYYTAKKAVELGLAGWVKNNPDGSVSLEIEGQKDKLDTMLDWLGHGPPYARVSEVKILPGRVKNYSVFEITS
jgi:acylphosphatase